MIHDKIKFASIILIILILSTPAFAEFDLTPYAIPPAVEIPDGAYAVWYIESADVNLPVYKSNGYDAQDIVDAEDSGVYMRTPSGYGDMVADHAYQGMDMEKCDIGDLAWLCLTDGTYKLYRCYGVILADSLGYCYAFNSSTIRTPADSLISINCHNADGTVVEMAFFEFLREAVR